MERGPAGAVRSGQPDKSIRRSRSGTNRADAGTHYLWHSTSRSRRRHPRCAGRPWKHRPAAASTLAVVLRFVDVAVDALAEAREEIDALNVYPVPDGDTGTNMYLTIERRPRRRRRGRGAGTSRPSGPALAAFAPGRAARRPRQLRRDPQRDARRARVAGSPAPTAEERNATVMADALAEATDASYAAVGTPVEGTILTVARAASEAADGVPASRRRGRATSSRPPPRRPARRWRARRTSSQALARRRCRRRRRPRARA